MNLAAIVGICVFSVGWLSSPSFGFLHGAKPASVLAFSVVFPQAGASSSGTSSSESQAPAAQQPSSTEAQNPTKPAPTSPKRRKHAKKAIYSDCSNAPAILNPTPGSMRSATPASTDQGTSGAATSTPAKNDSGKSSKQSVASNSRPCPPKKKIVRNGGTGEPDIELVGGTTAQQASSAHSTEEITAATEENLKKLEERQLSSNEQQTVSQIRQFMAESRQAIAAGDPERAQNLATKARLLSEELIKP
jgi:hypothetical protein